MLILGVESTCDETGAAVVEDGRKVLVNQLASSANILSQYGGIVPEIAAREQVKVIIPLIDSTLSVVPISKIDALAVSVGPGLIGSLLVGVETVKGLALSFDKPLIGVNHLEGHFYSSLLDSDEQINYPAVGLIVSGGHTDLVLVRKSGDFRILGETLDDAAGEAFDKVARFLNLPYPGGPAIEISAHGMRGKPVALPKPLISSNDFNFSFSGLKTAVVNFVKKNNIKLSKDNVSRVSYSFQKSVCDVLVSKTIKAAEKNGAKTILIGGGVVANDTLIKSISKSVGDRFKLLYPTKYFAVDNGAMIAGAAYFKKTFSNPLSLTANPFLHF